MTTKEGGSAQGGSTAQTKSPEWLSFIERDCSVCLKEDLDTVLLELRKLHNHPLLLAPKIIEDTTQHDDEDDDQGDQTKQRLKLRYCRYYLDCLSDLFSPWEDPVSEANKVYGTRHGVLPLLMDFSRPPYAKCVRRSAASALWNYGGLEVCERILLEEGVLELSLSLLEDRSGHIKSCGVNILWGCLEFEDVEQKAIEQGLAPKLITVLDEQLQHPDPRDDLILGALGNLQSCSTNLNCHKPMIEQGVVEFLVRIIPYDDTNFGLLPKYIKTVALGGLMLHVEDLKRLKEAKVTENIRTFLSKFTPSKVAAEEYEHGFVWSFVTNFQKLTLSYHPEVQELGAFCLASLAKKGSNRQKMLRENIIEKILCLQWSKNPQVKEFIKALLKEFRDNKDVLPNNGMPSLVEVCIYSIRHSLFRKSIAQKVLDTVPSTIGDRLREIRKIT